MKLEFNVSTAVEDDASLSFWDQNEQDGSDNFFEITGTANCRMIVLSKVP